MFSQVLLPLSVYTLMIWATPVSLCVLITLHKTVRPKHVRSHIILFHSFPKWFCILSYFDSLLNFHCRVKFCISSFSSRSSLYSFFFFLFSFFSDSRIDPRSHISGRDSCCSETRRCTSLSLYSLTRFCLSI